MSRIAAIVLAAGESRRWGRDNKLLASIDGHPMIMLTVSSLLNSTIRPVVVMLGHEAAAVEATLAGLPVDFQLAHDFANGMSATLNAGLRALPEDCDGALICLGDMPWICPATFDRLAQAFDPLMRAIAVIPTFGGTRGNPVLIGRSLFPRIAELSGDAGARSLLAAIPDRVIELAVDDPAVLRDVDQPDSLLVAT